MAGNSGPTDSRTPADFSFEHPYLKYEGSAMWTAIESGVIDLVNNGDLIERTNRKYIIGYLCKVLTEGSAKP